MQARTLSGFLTILKSSLRRWGILKEYIARALRFEVDRQNAVHTFFYGRLRYPFRQSVKACTNSTFVHSVDSEFSVDGAGIEHERFVIYGQHQ